MDDVKIPPPLQPWTPEHQIFSPSQALISPTTRSESDDEETDDDFGTDNRNPRNLSFDEYVDGDNVNNVDDDDDDDDVDDVLLLDDSITFDKDANDNPVSFIFFFYQLVFLITNLCICIYSIYFKEKIFPNYLPHIILKYYQLHERQVCWLQQIIMKYCKFQSWKHIFLYK